MTPILILVVAGAFVLLFAFVDLPLMHRGRAARSANGGRHTRSWWIALVAVLAIAVALALAQR